MSDPLPMMTPLPALGRTTAQVDTVGSLILAEETGLALASVSVRLNHEDACAAVLQDILGGQIPGIEEVVMHNPESAFWVGPNQWMVIAPHDTHEDLAAQLKSRLQASASVTEQNDAWVIFNLQGDYAPVMELLCPINLRTFDIGTARRTSIDHLGCFVTRRGEQHLQIFGPRSSAGSLHHALLTAMRAGH